LSRTRAASQNNITSKVNKKENIRTIMLSQGPTGSMYGDECKKQQRDLHPVSYLEHKKMAKSLSKRGVNF
jgi:hypothetical protein